MHGGGNKTGVGDMSLTHYRQHAQMFTKRVYVEMLTSCCQKSEYYSNKISNIGDICVSKCIYNLLRKFCPLLTIFPTVYTGMLATQVVHGLFLQYDEDFLSVRQWISKLTPSPPSDHTLKETSELLRKKAPLYNQWED